MSDGARIVVLGSINTDLVVRVPHIPAPGETLLGAEMNVLQGGKGANQAVAAARLGAVVTMIGCLGNDAFGAEALRALAAEGIDVSHVERITGVPSGVAMIALAEGGENSIIVSTGANGRVGPEHVSAALPAMEGAQVAVAQLEVPIDAVRAFLREARAHSVATILNPAPAHPEALSLLPMVDALICNETEATSLTGHDAAGVEAAGMAARTLTASGPRYALITLGDQGVVLCADGTISHTPAYGVPVIDTTGAGDTFVGAFAVRLALGDAVEVATRYASAAAALSVTRLGARGGMPPAAEVDAFLTDRGTA